MRIPFRLRLACGTAVRFRLRREANKFLAAAIDCRKAQHDVLRRLLALNLDSRFSHDHGLAEVRTVSEFRKHLPLADYEYFRPYIEQLKLGDQRALLGPKNRLLMFSLSSGTTAESKYIPITQQFLNDYRRGWQTWGILAFDEHPKVIRRNIVQFSSDHDRFRTPGGTPCGNISGLVAVVQNRFVRAMYTVPSVVSKIRDSDAKYYTAMRLAIADDNVGMITTANPSTLIHLTKLADAQKEQLIRDIADGTLSRKVSVGEEIRRKLQRAVSRGNRSRARQLEAIVEKTGSLDPSRYWEKLEILAVWCGGSAGAYLHSLRRYFGDVAIRDHGLQASEGRMTIPMADDRSAGVLDVTTHFFEFIPEDERDSEQPTVLEAHELQEDRNYYILLTTSSGLYRYDISDVVRCVGFHGTSPILEFLHKGAFISNITGEKVSESQVVAAVRSSLEAMELHLEHFTVSPVFGEPPRYQLFVEEQDIASPAVADRLVNSIDDCLKRLNCEYSEKRLSGRIGPMTWVSLPEGTWWEFIRRSQSKIGGSIEQYKHPCLVPDMNFGAKLLQEFAPNTSPVKPHRRQSELHLHLDTNRNDAASPAQT